MPPRAVANLLGLILLLAGSAVLAAEALPADGRTATTASSIGEGIRPWTVRQAPPTTPGDVFRPFDPPQGVAEQQAFSGGVNTSRDGSVPQQPKPEPVVPAAFQAPMSGSPSTPDVAPRPVADTMPRAASPPAVAASAETGTPSSAGQSVPLPLAPRRGVRPEATTAPGRSNGLSSLLTAGSSLAVVLGLFFVMAWLVRRAGPRGASLLPTEVVEVLGRAPLAARQQIHLLRLGNKLVLVCLHPDGAQPLAEITEPDEVTRLAGLCRQAQPNSTTAAFRQVFQQFHSEAGSSTSGGLSSHEDHQLANVGFKPIQGGRLEDHDG